MAWFQLDPQSIADRVHASASAAPLPTLGASVLRGIAGFTLLSVAGFLPWVIADLWLRSMGEMQLYLACAAVFIGLSGLFLHRLILGPGSLPRFYKLFSIAFAAYAIVWVFFSMWLRGHLGSIAGLFGGTAVMGLILVLAFDAPRSLPLVIAALFTLNTAGYYAGSWIEGKLAIDHRTAGMLLWGVSYGIGFGPGLGIAFHLFQQEARSRVRQGASNVVDR